MCWRSCRVQRAAPAPHPSLAQAFRAASCRKACRENCPRSTEKGRALRVLRPCDGDDSHTRSSETAQSAELPCGGWRRGRCWINPGRPGRARWLLCGAHPSEAHLLASPQSRARHVTEGRCWRQVPYEALRARSCWADGLPRAETPLLQRWCSRPNRRSHNPDKPTGRHYRQ